MVTKKRADTESAVAAETQSKTGLKTFLLRSLPTFLIKRVTGFLLKRVKSDILSTLKRNYHGTTKETPEKDYRSDIAERIFFDLRRYEANQRAHVFHRRATAGGVYASYRIGDD
jgi:hypothetical protein